MMKTRERQLRAAHRTPKGSTGMRPWSQAPAARSAIEVDLDLASAYGCANKETGGIPGG